MTLGLVMAIAIGCFAGTAVGWWMRSEQYRAHWREHTREWQRWQDTNCGACRGRDQR